MTKGRKPVEKRIRALSVPKMYKSDVNAPVTVTLTQEELEAMILKDFDGLDMVGGANSMRVSRQTFQLILKSGRNKVAEAMRFGWAIRIEGGNYYIEE